MGHLMDRWRETPPRGPRIRGVTSGEIFTLAGSDLFFRSLEVLALFFSVGPQAIAKYLKYFAFSRIGEAGGRAASDEGWGRRASDLFF